MATKQDECDYPRVSIGLPVYNGENYLEKALDSLLAQSFEDFELIIADNASTDSTMDICESYAGKDRRIRYFRNDANIGAAANYNRVFELSSGEYFKWAAHDDICDPGYLASSVARLDDDQGAVLCYPKEVAIDGKGKLIPDYMSKYAELKKVGSSKVHERLHDIACIHHGCYQVFGLVRSPCLKRTPKIASYIGADRVLLAELSLMGRFVDTPEAIHFRRHSEQYCALGDEKSRIEWYGSVRNGKLNLVMGRQLLEYLGAIKRTPLSWGERIRCWFVMLEWALRHRKLLGREFIGFVSNSIRTRFGTFREDAG